MAWHDSYCETNATSPGPFPCDCGIPEKIQRLKELLATSEDAHNMTPTEYSAALDLLLGAE